MTQDIKDELLKNRFYPFKSRMVSDILKESFGRIRHSCYFTLFDKKYWFVFTDDVNLSYVFDSKDEPTAPSNKDLELMKEASEYIKENLI